MLISVIIPVYNTKDYLEKCVDSVLACDTSDCEIVLVDDGSTDNVSGELCDSIANKYPGAVRVIHQQNKGLGGARNTGIDEASGEYLFFIDSDDTVAPSTLEILKNAIAETSADIISFNMVTDDGNGNGYSVKVNSFESEKTFKLCDHPEYILSLPSACCRIWKRELFEKTNIRFPDRVWYEDIRTTVKLFAVAESIFTIKNELYIYFQREGSIMRADNIARNREIIDAFDDLISWFKANELFDEYSEALCGLCIDNLYLAASVRVLKADTKHPLLNEFRSYVKKEFPEYKKNPYLARISGTRKLAYKLLEMKQYKLLSFLFSIKG